VEDIDAIRGGSTKKSRGKTAQSRGRHHKRPNTAWRTLGRKKGGARNLKESLRPDCFLKKRKKNSYRGASSQFHSRVIRNVGDRRVVVGPRRG